MKNKEPNYDMMLESAIIYTQLAYRDYSKLMDAYYQNSGIDSQGNFYVIGDDEEQKKKIKSAYKKYLERLKEQNAIKFIRDEWKEKQ